MIKKNKKNNNCKTDFSYNGRHIDYTKKTTRTNYIDVNSKKNVLTRLMTPLPAHLSIGEYDEAFDRCRIGLDDEFISMCGIKGNKKQ
jgi:hypothetical protein